MVSTEVIRPLHPSISAKKGGASLVWLSSPHPEMEEYQYSRHNAPFALVDANVAISIVSTVASLDIPMFSGGSVLIFSQEIGRVTCEPSTTGDPATGISHGLENDRRRGMVRNLKVEELEICDGETHRHLTKADTELFSNIQSTPPL